MIMRINKACLASFLTLAAAAHTLAGANGSAPVEQRAITVPSEFSLIAGEYRITVQEKPAWTLRSLSYRQKPVLIDNGWMQPVLNVQENGKSDFIGTGHGREVVSSLELVSDERPVTLHPNRSEYHAAPGATMRLTKRSVIGPYAHRSVLELTPMGLNQYYEFEVVGGTSNVNWLYAFMLIFPNTADHYRVMRADGAATTGTLPGSPKIQYSLHQDKVTEVSMYDSANGLVSTFVLAAAYATRNGKGAFFADRPKDNKFYLQLMPPLKRGEKASYRAAISAAEATKQTFMGNPSRTRSP